MASVIDICNLALGRLGDSATVSSIDPPEGSAQAEHCARFYPIALHTLLEMHDWVFASKRATLAELTSPSTAWTYAYAYPSDAVRIIAVYAADAESDYPSEPESFVCESGTGGARIILCNAEQAVARYTARVTDPTKFSPLFVTALTYLLASYLAGPVIKGNEGVRVSQGMEAAALRVLSDARQSDANQRNVKPDEHRPVWIAGR